MLNLNIYIIFMNMVIRMGKNDGRIHIITLPHDNPYLKIAIDDKNDKWRSNMLFIRNKVTMMMKLITVKNYIMIIKIGG
jgi:hypothetical protein